MISQSSHTMKRRGRSNSVHVKDKDQNKKLILDGKVVRVKHSKLGPYIHIGRMMMHVSVHSTPSEKYEQMELIQKNGELFVFFGSTLFKIDPTENIIQVGGVH